MWAVYRLVDPRIDLPFYVGCSVNPKNRLYGHKSDPCSSAWPRCRELRAAGLKPVLEVLGWYDNRREALWAEHDLIVATAGLVNLWRYDPDGVTWCPEARVA